MCGCAEVNDAQAASIDLEGARVVAGEEVEPALPRGAVDDPVGIAELVGLAAAPIGHRNAARERHRDLRPKTGGEAQRVLDRVAATGR